MSKDGPRVCRLGVAGVLAPAALSACMDASVLAVPAAGAIVSTLLKELSKAFMLKKWFHGLMSAHEAEHLIMNKGKNGSFLVRESQAHPGEYVLSVRVRGRVSHVMIRRQHDKYDVGSGELFDDLVGLIEHFRSYPMMETSGDVLRLLQPVSGYRLRSHAQQRPRAPAPQLRNHVTCDTQSNHDNEFQSLTELQERQTFTTVEGRKPENMLKNRYRNILPYDQTRVILRGCDGDGDYINANYVRPYRVRPRRPRDSPHASDESLHSAKSLFAASDTEKTTPLVSKSLSDDALRDAKKRLERDRINGIRTDSYDTVVEKTYIAVQGCMQNTRVDFWRMIWQEDVRVIAMITNEVEKGKSACAAYWPMVGRTERFGRLEVRGAAEERRAHGPVRRLLLSGAEPGPPRTVYQYQFTEWADHGAPEQPAGVLSFLAHVNQQLEEVARAPRPPAQNVLCVHCSAGVGRTGTFLVLDSLIDNVRRGGGGGGGEGAGAGAGGRTGSAHVAAAVAHARAQRPGMVQTEAQYRFLHRALRAYRAAHQPTEVYALDA